MSARERWLEDHGRPNSYQRWLDATDYEQFVKNSYEALVDQKIGMVRANQYLKGKKSGHTHQIDISIELSIADMSVKAGSIAYRLAEQHRTGRLKREGPLGVLVRSPVSWHWSGRRPCPVVFGWPSGDSSRRSARGCGRGG